MNSRNIKILGTVGVTCLLTFFQQIPVFALDEEITDKYPAAAQPPAKQEKSNLEKFTREVVKKFEINSFVDIQQGYDNNVELDSKRLKDGFFQITSNVDALYHYSDTVRFNAGMDAFDTTYYKYNVNNIFDLYPYIGVDWEIMPDIVWSNHIAYDYFAYPNLKESTYSGMKFSSYLECFMTEDIYHKIGYEHLKKWYPDSKIGLHDNRVGNDDRKDDRHKVKYTIGMYSPNYLVKVSNEVYYNDANDLYQDYYDFWVYRVRPSIMYFVTENIYLDLSLIYKHVKFDDRRSTENPDKKVQDNMWVLNAAVYYDFAENITVGLTYSYSENFSNDPFYKYSGSIFSGGIYYSF